MRKELFHELEQTMQGVTSYRAAPLSDSVVSRGPALSASGSCNHEAPSLHLRYGPNAALSTLDA